MYLLGKRFLLHYTSYVLSGRLLYRCDCSHDGYLHVGHVPTLENHPCNFATSTRRGVQTEPVNDNGTLYGIN